MTTVKMQHTNAVEAIKTREYACPADFCRLFTEEMQSLYQLSFLITANHRKAESCFLKSLEECFRAAIVLKEAIYSLARQVIIKNAIMMLTFQSENIEESFVLDPCMKDKAYLMAQEQNISISRIFILGDLERAIFVICVLERYSELKCASLLGCSRNAVRDVRNRALQQVVNHQLRNAASVEAATTFHLER
jgi:hypothetical protein